MSKNELGVTRVCVQTLVPVLVIWWQVCKQTMALSPWHNFSRLCPSSLLLFLFRYFQYFPDICLCWEAFLRWNRVLNKNSEARIQIKFGVLACQIQSFEEVLSLFTDVSTRKMKSSRTRWEEKYIRTKRQTGMKFWGTFLSVSWCFLAFLFLLLHFS